MTAHEMRRESCWSGWPARSRSSGSSRRQGWGSPRRAIAPCARHEAEFIAFLDGDDFWTPEKLERQLPAFARSEKIGLVYGDFVEFSRDDATDGRVITVRRFDPESARQLRDYFVHDGPIMPSTAVVRRSVFDDVGPLRRVSPHW